MYQSRSRKVSQTKVEGKGRVEAVSQVQAAPPTNIPSVGLRTYLRGRSLCCINFHRDLRGHYCQATIGQ